jgi:hypothetical protein
MTKERGSEALRRMHGGNNGEHLEGIYRAIDALEEIKILRWINRGTPVWDRVSAVFEVSAGNAGRLVDQIVRNEQLAPNIRVFPYGIPIPDIAIIELDAERR